MVQGLAGRPPSPFGSHSRSVTVHIGSPSRSRTAFLPMHQRREPSHTPIPRNFVLIACRTMSAPQL